VSHGFSGKAVGDREPAIDDCSAGLPNFSDSVGAHDV
jgi:hypothetical protein